MSATVCVLGVDSMEPTLILDWIASGDLPNLARLRQRGAWGTVLNPPRFFSGASWPNFYTGVRPARHDQYRRTLYDPQRCFHTSMRPNRDGVDAFWLRDEWRNQRTAISCLPYCPDDARINGVQVVDRYAHDTDHEPGATMASAVAGKAVRDFSHDSIVNCYDLAWSTAAFADFHGRVLRRMQRKLEAACHLLASDRWDLFIAAIDEPHCAGHRLWHLHDAGHPRHDPATATALPAAIKRIYVEIDSALGAMLDLLEPSATVLFLSSHGMGPAFDGNGVLDEILRRLDGFEPRDTRAAAARLAALTRWQRIFNRLPPPARWALEPLRRRFGRRRLREQLSDENRRRRYFWFPTHDLWGGIRINLAGRESSGLVQPGREYEEIVAQLTEDLHQLCDGRSGEPIVDKVVSASDIDLEGYAGDFPDLVVQWSKAALSWIESPKVGRVEPVLVYGRTGDHPPAMEGIVFAAGPDIISGRLPNPVHLEDFAPTISAMLGIHLNDTDGALIANLCEPPSPQPSPQAPK